MNLSVFQALVLASSQNPKHPVAQTVFSIINRQKGK